MGRFRFSLQRVLDYRVQQEEEARLHLAKANAILNRLRERKRRIEKEIEETHGSFERKKGGTYAWFLAECEKNLTREREWIEKEISQQIDRVETLKKEYIQRMLERKKMEKLKEKQEREFYYEEAKKEQKQADEISTLRFERDFY